MAASTYPAWVYDDSVIPDPLGYGERAVTFLRRLRHPKSTWPRQAFQLDPWAERVVRAIYGPRHPDGTRIVKSVILLLPRGSRKTSLSAALALLHTIGPERTPGGEAIFAASDREQAGIGFREALGIVRADPRLAAAVKVYDAHNSAKKIVYGRDAVTLQAISSDAGAQHGRTPSFVLADELHVWPDKYLWEALRTGLDKVDNTLLVVATTAGRGQQNIAWEIVEDARRVARGEATDPSLLPVLFEAQPSDDWRDEAVWFRTNPGLQHGYPSLEGFRRHAAEAERRAGERDSFLQLKLNRWAEQTTSPFVSMDVWDEGAAPIDLAALLGRRCWIGLDASATTDLTAACAVFRDDDGGYTALPHFWLPGRDIQAREDRDGVAYRRWQEQGHVTLTPGDVIDPGMVADHLRRWAELYQVQEIPTDPAYSRAITVPLVGEGYPVVEFRQGWRSMGPAIADLETAIVGRRFRHGGNPVLRWNVASVAIQTDSSGNKSFHKGKSRSRIDGAVAAAMGVRRAAEGGAVRRSILEDPTVTAADLVLA